MKGKGKADGEGRGELLDVRVVPRAGRSGITGVRDGVVHVRIAAPPVDGAANDELIETLARALRVSKRAVEIVSGATSRSKRVRIEGLDRSAILAALGASH